MIIATAGENNVRLVGEAGPFTITLTSSGSIEGVETIELDLLSEAAAIPPKLELLFDIPCVDISSIWSPLAHRNRGIPPNWAEPFRSSATTGAPVVSVVSGSGGNRVTVALSDALRPARMRANISEETALLECGAVIFEGEVNEYAHYSVVLRIDRRDFPYYKSLDDVRLWWENMPGYEPAAVPDAARNPMYSTWYSFHQALNPEAVEKQCALAKALGCDAVIVDDGWQCDDNSRGYAFCGDWEVQASKIPDMAAHVRRVHELGMKYILWYSVPFVGRETKSGQRFAEKVLLPQSEDSRWSVLDPRYPAVREYLIGTYENAVRDWDLDGFKLDFVDSFRADAAPPLQPAETDYKSVPEAVDRLLTDVISRLRQLKPDICVEFRQGYIGPLMRKYGNMFRSGDCPVDYVQNRVNTVDIRLICGKTAAHADMLMWHSSEPVESAALHIINALFSVPQVSVMLDTLPADHHEMVKFWLNFWMENRGLLLDAPIEPLYPELLYSQIAARDERHAIVAAYGPNFVQLDPQMPPELIVINGTRTDGIHLAGLAAGGAFEADIKDCRGRSVGSQQLRVGQSAVHIATPAAGLAYIKAV